jgi:hypothetical protein
MTPAELERLARERLGPTPAPEHVWNTLNDPPPGVAPLEWWGALDAVTRTDRRATP